MFKRRYGVNCSLHPSVLHFFSLLVVLFAFAGRRGGQGDAHDGGAVEASPDCFVEGIHVLGQEPLADCLEGLHLLCFIRYQLCFPESHGGSVLQGEASVLGTDGGLAFGDG